MKSILLLAFVLGISGTVAAVDPYEGPGHMATFCIPCHQRFSESSPYAVNISYVVKNPGVLSIFPCIKPGCHKYNKRFIYGESREALHLTICSNCHVAENGRYDIHKNHFNLSTLEPPWKLKYPANLSLRREEVKCEICHSRNGYKSLIATVPPYESSIQGLIGGVIKPPWNNDCSYCHPTVRGAKRLHDVHEPTILKACPVCHTSNIFAKKGLVEGISGQTFPGERIVKKAVEPLLVKELRVYFNSIAEQMGRIYASLREMKI